MKVMSRSTLLSEESTKAAVAACGRVAALARRFDAAHAEAEKAPTQANKQAKVRLKDQLTDAISQLEGS